MSMDYFEQADKQIVGAIQKETGAVVDYYFGHQSLFNLFLKICNFDEYSPIAVEMYNGKMIMANKNQVHFDMPRNAKSVKDYKFAVSGTFQDRPKNKIVSILVNNGEVLGHSGSKTWRDKAEGTIYMTADGKIGWRRVQYIDSIPNVKWSISGVTVHDYHPVWEGFTGRFADVLRPAEHILFGITQDDKVVVFFKNCTMGHLKYISDKVLKLKYSISLDGGSVAAINSPKFSYNKYTKQNNVVWFK